MAVKSHSFGGVIMFEYDFLAIVDGSCEGNGSANAAGFGSYVRSNVTREKNGDPA
jgi:hypothetical protein